MHYRSILAVCAAFAAVAADVAAGNFVEGAGGEPAPLKAAATMDSLQSDADKVGQVQRKRSVAKPLIILTVLGVALAMTYMVVQCLRAIASVSMVNIHGRRLAAAPGGCIEDENKIKPEHLPLEDLLKKAKKFESSGEELTAIRTGAWDCREPEEENTIQTKPASE